MKQSTKQWFGLLAASALVFGAATAVGQGMGVGPGMGMGPGMGGHQGMMGVGPGGMGPGMGGGSVAAATEQLARTKSALGITDAQEGAWKAYEQAVINQSALMSSHRDTMMSGGTRPAGDQRAAMHQQGSAMMQQTVQARQNLYQVLSPAQKTTAGNLMGPRGRM